MSVQKIIEEARPLSIGERKELVKVLVDMLTQPSEMPKKQRSLLEFRRLGAHLYDETDAQEYVNQLRSEWDDRP